MNLLKSIHTTLCLVLSLSQFMSVQAKFAGRDAKIVQFTGHSLMTSSPEWMVEEIGLAESSSVMSINGRQAQGKEIIRDGEVVRSLQSPVQLTLHDVGIVQLASHSEIKVRAVQSDQARRVLLGLLTADLITGTAILRLNPRSTAYVSSTGGSFLANSGAQFEVTAGQDRPSLRIIAGDVVPVGGWSVNPMPRASVESSIIQPVSNEAPTMKYSISMIESENEVAVGALTRKDLKFKVTDQNAMPVPRLLVTFSLNANEGQMFGVLGHHSIAARKLTVSTDSQGVAVVPFRAGSRPGSMSITATVEENGASQNSTISVTPANDKFWTKKNAIPVLATAAAIILAGVLVVTTRTDRFPIKESSLIEIVP
jgi:hypothetical protein